MSRLLFITCHKLDENNGGANGSKGFIRCFAALFDDCSLIYPEFEDTASYIPSKYKLYPCHDSRSKLRKGFDMYRGVVGSLYYCVREHLKNHSYDVIVIDHSATGTGLVKTIKATGAKIITIHHNVERDYLRDNGRERPLTYRLPYNFFAKKAERDCLKASDINLTVTERDANVFKTWFEGAVVYNWGNFMYRPIDDKAFNDKQDERNSKPTFIITGSLSFPQSVRPILEFVHRYWPRVEQACPHAHLIIAGRNPVQALTEACAMKGNIELVPNPDDMAEYISKAHCYVCPIDEGSGRKLRITDGLKEGLPVLCHDVSASGYECMAEAGCLFAYHDETSFDTSLHNMLYSPIKPDTVYRVFRDNYSIEAGVRKLRNILSTHNSL